MYLLFAFICGLALSMMMFVEEVFRGNINHLKNGRVANAGAAIFPTFPIVPLAVVGVAWVGRTLLTDSSNWVLGGVAIFVVVTWSVSMFRLRAELVKLQSSPPGG